VKVEPLEMIDWVYGMVVLICAPGAPLLTTVIV
jgi:hypothetical protein